MLFSAEDLENFFSTNRFSFFTFFDGFGKCDVFKWLHAVAASLAPKDTISFENLHVFPHHAGFGPEDNVVWLS